MKISFCNIVKDDSEFDSWRKMLLSVMPFVDSIHITANGGNVDKIRRYCRANHLDYTYRPWTKDYSDQRNFNFNRAKDADLILWMDSDDTLVGGQFLRPLAEKAIAQEYDTIFLRYWYGCKFKGEPSLETLEEVELYHYRERLIKPGKITWKKRIHETPVPIEGAKYKYNRIDHTPSNKHKEYPIAVLHRGADRFLSEKELAKKMARNKEMLELELEDERKSGEADPRTLLYLMKIYSEGDEPEEWAKSIGMGQEYLEKSGWDEERGVCAVEMAKAFGKRGSDDAAAKILHRSIEEWPYNPLTHLMLSEAYFNLKNYPKMEFWMKTGLKMDIEEASSSMQNILQMKLLSAQLLLRFYSIVKPDADKALEAARTLYAIEKRPDTFATMDHFEQVKVLNDACRHVDKLTEYYASIGDDKAAQGMLESLPSTILERPFAIKLKNKYKEPKKWGPKEICYFANFGQAHFENWSPKSLQKGIGGSETAVIELSKEWTNMGYKVTVYGDPNKEKGDHNGVTYLPYYEFNIRDHFNIFIQWRSNYLAKKIKSKKFIVDLHDVWSAADYSDLDCIDKIMVKSKYHRNLAPSIPYDKFLIISNGIRV
jgi:tetratricopeptide (TPR) repeat protein